MKDKPLVFNFLSLFFLIVALSLPLQIMWIYGHGLSELAAVTNKLTLLNILCFGLLLINSWLTFKVDRFLNLTLPALGLLICYNNYTVSLYGSDFSFAETLCASLSFSSIILGFYLAGGGKVLKTPDKWWWKTPKRLSLKRPTALWNVSGRFLVGDTVNLSSSGVFVKFHEKIPGESSIAYKRPRPGEVFEVHIQTRNTDCLNCRGTVVREVRDGSGIQTGVGIRFESMGLLDRLRLYRFLFIPQLIAQTVS